MFTGAWRNGTGLHKHEICLPTLHSPTQTSDGNAPPGNSVAPQNTSMNFKTSVYRRHEAEYVHVHVGKVHICGLRVKQNQDPDLAH